RRLVNRPVKSNRFGAWAIAGIRKAENHECSVSKRSERRAASGAAGLVYASGGPLSRPLPEFAPRTFLHGSVQVAEARGRDRARPHSRFRFRRRDFVQRPAV